jgi:NAD-dependent DNA ligase
MMKWRRLTVKYGELRRRESVKTYFINPFRKKSTGKNLDPDGQPVCRGFNAGMRSSRSMDELIGICKGCVVDGVISIEEARFLADWLEQNREIARSWPANILAARIDAIFADGAVDDVERADLFSVLTQITGGIDVPAGGAAHTTTLPIDRELKPIAFDERAFCLTGKFAYGPRDRCERDVISKGGVIKANVSKQLHYLVIGTIGSADWIHSTYGRKIEAAVELREQGVPLHIVPEEHWVSELVK